MGRPLRIALVVERFEPRGGVEGVAWAVAHGLAAAGDAVHVVCRVAPPGLAGTGAGGGAPAGPVVERVRVPAAWQPLRVRAFSRAAARATRPRVGRGRVAPPPARTRFDVVQSFSRTRHQDVYRAGGGCHAAYMERAYGPAGARLRRVSPRHAVLLAIEAAVFADPRQTILCNSAMVRDEIAARYAVAPERLVVLANGVDLARFDAAAPARRAARERLRRELAAEGETVFLLVGHGFQRKGVDTALRALAASKDPTSRLWIAGGDAPAPWRRLAESLGVAARVRFLGARDDVADLLAAADALLLPTRYDAFANACLEAAAASRPSVTSGANGAAGFLGDAAVAVPSPEDVAGFAGALDALADASVRTRLGARARARAETASWARHVERLRELYRTIAA